MRSFARLLDRLSLTASRNAKLTLVRAVAPKFATPIILGAPVATGVLEPVVTRLSPDGTTVLASQPVAGYVINPNQTTQNSRKVGRGV